MAVVYNVLFDRPLVFRFFQVVFSVFSASFQFQFSDSARTMFNVYRVQLHLTRAVFGGFHSV